MTLGNVLICQAEKSQTVAFPSLSTFFGVLLRGRGEVSVTVGSVRWLMEEINSKNQVYLID